MLQIYRTLRPDVKRLDTEYTKVAKLQSVQSNIQLLTENVREKLAFFVI